MIIATCHKHRTMKSFTGINTMNTIIKDSEKFNPENHPHAIHELSALSQGISHISIYFKVEIVVSFLKDHCLRTDWIHANLPLTRMMTSGFFKTSNLESLFESCRSNKVFLTEFEHYIGKQILGRNYY